MANREEVDLIVRAITEGFDKVAEDIGDVSDSLDDNTEATKNAGTRFTELASKISVAQEAFAAVGQVAEKTYDTIKRGAEVEAVAQTFDSLSTSIGETSDVMINELRVATQGMVADFDLMTSANRFMAMGLAGSAEEAAKLSEVAVTLGAAMGTGPNQAMEDFALLLANQSIPRLDTFGISSGRVRERVNELTTGVNALDRETAFLQATMEEAEKTMVAVGGASDNLNSDIAKLEASTKNLSDRFSVAFSRRWAPIIGGVVNVVETYEAAQRDLTKAVEAGIISQEDADRAYRNAIIGLDGGASVVKDAREELEELTRAQEEHEQMMADVADRYTVVWPEVDRVALAQEALQKELSATNAQVMAQNAAFEQYAQGSIIKANERIEEQRQKLVGLRDEQMRFIDSIEGVAEDYIQAQEDMEAAQGEFVNVSRDNSAEIADINAQLFGDLDKDSRDAMNDVLRNAEEGGAEWLAAFDATQNDLTDSQRMALVARKAELEATNGEISTIYTGDAAAFEEAQQRKIEAERALTQAISEEAFKQAEARILAESSEGAIEQVKALEQLQVDLGIKTQEAADIAIAQAEAFGQAKEVTDQLLDVFLEDGVLAQDESERLANAIGLIGEGAELTTEQLVTLGLQGTEHAQMITDGLIGTETQVLNVNDSLTIMDSKLASLTKDEHVITVRVNTIGEVPGATGAGVTSDVMENSGVN